MLTGFYILAYAFVDSEWYVVLKGIVDQGLLKLRDFVTRKLQRHSRFLFQVWILADRVWEGIKSELEEMQRRDEKRSRGRREHRASTCRACVDDSMAVNECYGCASERSSILFSCMEYFFPSEAYISLALSLRIFVWLAPYNIFLRRESSYKKLSSIYRARNPII